MLDKLTDAAFRLSDEFSWRKVAVLLAVVIALLVGAILYERYTSSFRLGRLQREVEVLAQLRSIDSSGWAKDTNILAVRRRLSRDFRLAAETELVTPDLSKLVRPFARRDWLAQFVAGGVWGWLIAILALFLTYRGNLYAPLVVFPTLGLGALSGLIALLVLPPEWPMWANYGVFPITITLSLLGLSGLTDAFRVRFRSAKRAAQEQEALANASGLAPYTSAGSAGTREVTNGR